MILDIPTNRWRLWCRGEEGYELRVYWPNSLAAPIVVTGKSLPEMCGQVRALWNEAVAQ